MLQEASQAQRAERLKDESAAADEEAPVGDARHEDVEQYEGEDNFVQQVLEVAAAGRGRDLPQEGLAGGSASRAPQGQQEFASC